MSSSLSRVKQKERWIRIQVLAVLTKVPKEIFCGALHRTSFAWRSRELSLAESCLSLSEPPLNRQTSSWVNRHSYYGILTKKGAGLRNDVHQPIFSFGQRDKRELSFDWLLSTGRALLE
jgi:hypothetical protein